MCPDETSAFRRLERVITGELKNKVDTVWNAFWSGGISNPLQVIEQITYLLFLRKLDDQQTAEENKAELLGGVVEKPVFGPDEQQFRWSHLRNMDAQVAFDTMAQGVFPFLRNLGGTDSDYAAQMENATFTIPTPALLSKVIDLLNDIPMNDRDTNGDLYEYLLGKIASAGVNGQFRTPRHIINFIVELMDPKPGDRIVDPAAGTAGFLVSASEYVREKYPEVKTDPIARTQFHNGMFHGYDFDPTMLRIGAMNMMMHGIDTPVIQRRDSLADGVSEDAGRYTMILANPPFAGSLDYESTSKDLLKVAKTKKTELLFLALFLQLLEPGGRAAVIVPDGVLFGSTTAHKALRKALVEDNKLDAVIKLPAGVFKPYAGVSTAILFFTKVGQAGQGGTDEVWFYDVAADGFSLDEKRTPIEANDLPDAKARWSQRSGAERDRTRSDQSFAVSKNDILAHGYDLSISRYKEVVHEEIAQREPREIIAEIEAFEVAIVAGIAELKELLS